MVSLYQLDEQWFFFGRVTNKVLQISNVTLKQSNKRAVLPNIPPLWYRPMHGNLKWFMVMIWDCELLHVAVFHCELKTKRLKDDWVWNASLLYTVYTNRSVVSLFVWTCFAFCECSAALHVSCRLQTMCPLFVAGNSFFIPLQRWIL